jgi:hypothetical protein
MVGVPNHAQAMSLLPFTAWLSGRRLAAGLGGEGFVISGIPQNALLDSTIKPIAMLLLQEKISNPKLTLNLNRVFIDSWGMTYSSYPDFLNNGRLASRKLTKTFKYRISWHELKL